MYRVIDSMAQTLSKGSRSRRAYRVGKRHATLVGHLTVTGSIPGLRPFRTRSKRNPYLGRANRRSDRFGPHRRYAGGFRSFYQWSAHHTAGAGSKTDYRDQRASRTPSSHKSSQLNGCGLNGVFRVSAGD